MNFLLAWARLCQDVDPQETKIERAASEALGRELAARHSEPHRHYHTIEHIEAVLDHLETLGAATPTARFAAFFHDAIYDGTASDNEQRSAALAEQQLRELGVADDTIGEVVALVLATQDHSPPVDGPRETAAFLDADLAILGQPAPTYDTYCAAIRREYAHLNDATFRSGRGAVIAMLAARADQDELFFTSTAKVQWQSQAAANLHRELAALTERP